MTTRTSPAAPISWEPRAARPSTILKLRSLIASGDFGDYESTADGENISVYIAPALPHDSPHFGRAAPNRMCSLSHRLLRDQKFYFGVSRRFRCPWSPGRREGPAGRVH